MKKLIWITYLIFLVLICQGCAYNKTFSDLGKGYEFFVPDEDIELLKTEFYNPNRATVRYRYGTTVVDIEPIKSWNVVLYYPEKEQGFTIFVDKVTYKENGVFVTDELDNLKDKLRKGTHGKISNLSFVEFRIKGVGCLLWSTCGGLISFLSYVFLSPEGMSAPKPGTEHKDTELIFLASGTVVGGILGIYWEMLEKENVRILAYRDYYLINE